MNILSIDVGGSHVKCLASGRSTLTAAEMVRRVLQRTRKWSWDAVSIG